MKRITILFPILLITFCAFGQLKKKNIIEHTINQIENGKSLAITEFDRVSLLGPNYGEGTIRVWHTQAQIHKIEEVVGLTYGRSKEIVYFDGGQPIKIIEIEENFPKTKKGFKEAKMEEVFRTEIYVLGKADSVIENYYIIKEEFGKRFFTNPTNFDQYLDSFQMAELVLSDED